MPTFRYFLFSKILFIGKYTRGSGSDMSGIRRVSCSSYWNYSSSIFKKSHKSDSDAQIKTLFYGPLLLSFK